LVFAAGACASAQTGQSDRLKLSGGLSLSSPFGTFPTSDISQDKVDGIGLWKVSDLANALLSGVSPNGAHYYPSFPYPSWSERDVAELLKTGNTPSHGRVGSSMTDVVTDGQKSPWLALRRL
jgi:hypothetical protein